MIVGERVLDMTDYVVRYYGLAMSENMANAVSASMGAMSHLLPRIADRMARNGHVVINEAVARAMAGHGYIVVACAAARC